MTKRPTARLGLEDGSVFYGVGFGELSPRSIDGEVCFNTSLIGYQEILTDPSYAGQIVTMTYPLIGNYGINAEDLESRDIFVRGFVVRELSNLASNFRATQSLEDWLAQKNITGITGIDTRALTRKLRIEGALKGVLSTESDSNLTDTDLVEMAKQSAGLVGIDLVKDVTSSKASIWSENLGDWEPIQGDIPKLESGFHVVALDCGAKLNILRNLVHCGCKVTVLPYDSSPEAILEHNPDGLFVSNGPGDPSAVKSTVANLQQLLGKLPIFGICLGHQLLSLSMRAETFKLKFGHRCRWWEPSTAS